MLGECQYLPRSICGFLLHSYKISDPYSCTRSEIFFSPDIKRTFDVQILSILRFTKLQNDFFSFLSFSPIAERWFLLLLLLLAVRPCSSSPPRCLCSGLFRFPVSPPVQPKQNFPSQCSLNSSLSLRIDKGLKCSY